MIDKLNFLLALAQEQHFGRAAEACGVTQPTLSAGIKQLENTLGVLLVQRSARFGGFTPEGQRVLEWARRIVGDARAMREEVHALRDGLSGHLRLAAVPTSLPFLVRLTTPLRQAHPDLTFSIRSATSLEVLTLMENLEADAGITYVDAEKLGRVRHVTLYEERYRLLVSRDTLLGGRDAVGWADVATIPLCLLTADMQNRRIIDRRLLAAGAEPSPVLESNSMIVLVSHVRSGSWASVLPAVLADTLGVGEPMRSIPIVDEAAGPSIGLVYPQREPLTPLITALLTVARRITSIPSRV